MSAAQCVSCSKQEQITTLHTFGWYWLHPSSGIILIGGVYSWNRWDAIVAKQKLKGICSQTWWVLSNVSVAPNRNKLPHHVHLAGSGCTHLLALYWMMVFIHETHVMPPSGKVETKRHLLSYLVLAGSECCPMCQLLQQEQINTLRTFGLYRLHPSCGIILIDGVYSWKTCDAISGKLKTKQQQINTLCTFIWNWLHPSSGIILIFGVYSWKTCDAIMAK